MGFSSEHQYQWISMALHQEAVMASNALYLQSSLSSCSYYPSGDLPTQCIEIIQVCPRFNWWTKNQNIYLISLKLTGAAQEKTQYIKKSKTDFWGGYKQQ